MTHELSISRTINSSDAIRNLKTIVVVARFKILDSTSHVVLIVGVVVIVVIVVVAVAVVVIVVSAVIHLHL